MRKSITLRQLFNIGCKNAERIFNEDGQIVPIWHAVAEQEPDLLIATPWRNDEEKDAATDALREMFQEHQIQRFVFVTEAWSVMGRDPDVIMSERPSQHPDRREVIRVQAEDRNGRTLSGQFYILRPEHGPATLSPFHEDPPDMVSAGRMSGLLVGTKH